MKATHCAVQLCRDVWLEPCLCWEGRPILPGSGSFVGYPVSFRKFAE